MPTIAEVFRAFGPAYVERFPNLPTSHQRVIDAICLCRSGWHGTIG